MAVRELPKDVLKMASGLISPSGLAGHRRQLCTVMVTSQPRTYLLRLHAQREEGEAPQQQLLVVEADAGRVRRRALARGPADVPDVAGEAAAGLLRGLARLPAQQDGGRVHGVQVRHVRAVLGDILHQRGYIVTI